MVIVLISARYKTILDWIHNDSQKDIIDIKTIKQNGGQIFLYVQTNMSQENVIKYFHQIIQRNCHGALVYEFYGIYNGKIDFQPYLSSQTKNQMKYFQSNNKDITEKDIEKYLQR